MPYLNDKGFKIRFQKENAEFRNNFKFERNLKHKKIKTSKKLIFFFVRKTKNVCN